ncbi:hypothetical protein MCHI_003724 [Candidatus Magnetoovum chiemensis]|nr:hypothetical protein MCHI_003724 [Candidatus Magnetoovum chiemensis]
MHVMPATQNIHLEQVLEDSLKTAVSVILDQITLKKRSMKSQNMVLLMLQHLKRLVLKV